MFYNNIHSFIHSSIFKRNLKVLEYSSDYQRDGFCHSEVEQILYACVYISVRWGRAHVHVCLRGRGKTPMSSSPYSSSYLLSPILLLNLEDSSSAKFSTPGQQVPGIPQSGHSQRLNYKLNLPHPAMGAGDPAWDLIY